MGRHVAAFCFSVLHPKQTWIDAEPQIKIESAQLISSLNVDDFVLAHNMAVIARSRRQRNDLSADMQVCGPEPASSLSFLAVTRFCHWIMIKYMISLLIFNEDRF